MCPAFIDLAIHGESPDPVLSVPVPAGIHLPLYFFFPNHLSCVYLSSGPPETPGACVATCKSRRQLLQLRVSAIWCRVLLGFVPEGAEIHQQRLIDVNKLSALMLRPLVLCLHVGSHHFDKQTNGGQQMPSVDVVRHINRLHLIKVPKGRRRSVTNSPALLNSSQSTRNGHLDESLHVSQ